MRAPAACLLALSLSPLTAEDAPTPPGREVPAVPATATPPPAPPPVNAQLSLGFGYDSNILLVNEADPIVTNRDSSVITGSARIGWRALDRDGLRIDVVARSESQEYAESDDRRLFEYGLAIAASTRDGRFAPGLIVAGDRFDIAGSGAATVIDFVLDGTVIGYQAVGIPQLEALRLDYDHLDLSGGWLYDASYRHWFLINPGTTRRRIEIGMRGGYFLSDTDSESYLTVRAGAAFRYRFGETVDRDTIDLVARAQVEYRHYDAPMPSVAHSEAAFITGIELGSDYWLNPWIALGTYARFSERSSDVEMRDYDRIQIGARITVGW